MRVRAFTKKIDKLKELIDVQCTDGNWNYDPYMHGMANGMILSVSVMDGSEPEFKEAPEQWIKDKTAQIVREPRSFDFAPGTSEVTPNVMWQGAPADQRTKAVQTDQWANSVATTLSDGMTTEQLYQVLSRIHNVSREDLEKIRERYKQHAIIAPLVLSKLSDRYIKTLVGNHDEDLC